MKFRLMVITLWLLVFMSDVAVAQRHRVSRKTAAPVAPPSLLLDNLAAVSQPDGMIGRLIATQPTIPLGPVDVLKAYENGMTLIAQRLSADLVGISQAKMAHQITRDEAEYLMLERYQVAMMQHEVLSALHDALERDLEQIQTPPDRFNSLDTAVVVQPSSWSRQGRLQ